MNLERVGKNSTFARDNNTGAILNTDQESDISEIKSLLSTLLQNIGGK